MGAWKYQIYFSSVEINLVFPRTHVYNIIISFDHYNFMETQRKFSNIAISKAFVRSPESLQSF